MRMLFLTAAAAAFVLLGTASCVELLQSDTVDHVGGSPSSRNRLSVSVATPASDITAPADGSLDIRWSAANTTGSAGRATVLVVDLNTLTEITLADGLTVQGSSRTVTTRWETADFEPGPYRVRVRITAGGQRRESTAAGVVLINASPTFEFLSPTSNTTLPDSDSLEIRYDGIDPEGNGRVTFFVDPDDTDTTDNRVQISSSQTLNDSADDEDKTFDWNGDNNDGTRVATGTYSLIAVVTDGINPEQTFVAGGRVTVPDPAEPTAQLGFALPEEDTTFLTTDAPLSLRLNVNRTSEHLLDIAIDTDDNHGNGNETTILSQRVIAEDTDTTDFDWDGSDSDGNAVPEGIYRLFLVSSTGAGTPTIQQASALVFRRSDPDQPLIGLLQPATVQTVNPGAFLNISWRDDDPAEDATIRLTIDDDNRPDEASETDEDEIEILAGRAAMPDGVQDTFAYRIPSSLPPGTYFIFAYIDATPGSAVADHISVGPVAFRVEDPAAGGN